MNNIFVSWKQKIESRIISDLKSQYTESEEQIRQRKEQVLKKQKKIILIEIIAGAVFKKAEEDYINRNHSRSSFFGFFDYKSSLFAR